MKPKTKTERFVTRDPLVVFLYVLLRDYVPFGTLETIMLEQVENDLLGEGVLSEPVMARYATALARRLRDEAEPVLEGEEYGPCPRRRDAGPWDPDEADRWVDRRWRGEGDWRLDWFPRSCSFCGCVHPDDAMRLLEEGWEVEVTRKIHKFYVHPPGTAERIEASIVGIRERGIDGMVETWSPVPPVKGYAAHFTAEQLKRVNAAITRLGSQRLKREG